MPTKNAFKQQQKHALFYFAVLMVTKKGREKTLQACQLREILSRMKNAIVGPTDVCCCWQHLV